MKSNIKIGDVFGRLKVISFNTKARWAALCRCECGVQKEVLKKSLNYGETKSCGCLQKDTAKNLNYKHGEAVNKTQVYNAWTNMKARCSNENHPEYLHYGARGITVCDEWKIDFTRFAKDMGDRPYKGTLERINTNEGYYKENCHWVVHKLNAQNTRTCKFWYINGRKFDSLNDAAKHFSKGQGTIFGWCEGYTVKGKKYPPKENCWSEKKYV